MADKYEIVECMLCGKEDYAMFTHERFVGKLKYICHECYIRGDNQMFARYKARHKAPNGKKK